MDGRGWRVAGVVVLFVVFLVLGWVVLTNPTSVRPAAENGKADPGRLARHVETLCTFDRSHDSPEGLTAAGVYIREQWEAMGYAVEYQPLPGASRHHFNVTTHWGTGDGPRIVVGAHYDAFGGYPGADDNASGVAGLLELSRLLKEHGPAPRRRIDLVAYTLEEPPFFAGGGMGSAVHAASLKRAGATVDLMVSLEMIGYFSDVPESQQLPVGWLKYLYPLREGRGDFIAVIGNLGGWSTVRRFKKAMQRHTPLAVFSLNGPTWVPGVDWSDHRSYWAQGFPAVMITDTSLYRNPHYHTAGDRPETLDYRRMAQVVDGVRGALDP